MLSITHSYAPYFMPITASLTNNPGRLTKKRKGFEINWPPVRLPALKRKRDLIKEVSRDTGWLEEKMYEEMRRRW